MKKATLAIVLIMMLAPVANAIPELQIYIEGADYDNVTETWVYTGSDPIKLWTIANVGAKGPISDVKLAVAYTSPLSPAISLLGSTTGGLGSFTDPSQPADVLSPSRTVTDGSVPQFGNGKDLPSHGIYGAGTYWQEFLLGDFDQSDSPIADFITSFPSPHATARGQINVYEVSVAGLGDEDYLHFDLYNSYYNEQSGKAMYVKAPFSHDGETGAIPEPGTLALLGLGLAGLGARLRRKSR